MPKTKSQLKYLTELLIKDIGVEAACKATGRSKVTLGRYYSTKKEHADRIIPIDVVAQIEVVSKYPRMTLALAQMNGGALVFQDADNLSTSHWRKIDANANLAKLRRALTHYKILSCATKVPNSEIVDFERSSRKLQKVLARMERNLAICALKDDGVT